MKNVINIQTITWELEARSVAEAKEWQNTVSSFSHYQLSSLIEETLAPYNDDYRNITIDTLELDVKDITNPEEIKQSLLKMVQAFFANYAIKEEHYSKERPYAILEALQYYFLHGHLPWHADKKIFAHTELLLQQLISYTPTQLKSAIRVTNNAAVIRLVQLLGTEEQIKQFLAYLEGSNSTETAAVAEFTQTIINIVLGASQQQMPKIMLIYKALFQYWFSHQTFNAENFLTFWWTDIVETQMLSATEQGMVSEYLIQYTSPQNSTIPIINNAFIAKHKLWIEELKTAITNSNAVTNNIKAELIEAKAEQKNATPSNVTSFYIENAGGILLYYYLKFFFKEAELLNDAGLFSSTASQIQAVSLLQFAICGHSNFQEYDLVLNKILCGYDIESPITAPENSDLFDIEKANRLLQQVINSWRKIGNTSPDGLRQSFLLRNGKLVQENNNWILYIERKSIDVLIDALPYPISVIKLTWMPKPLFVQW